MTEIPWTTLKIEALKFLVSKSTEAWVVDGDKRTVRSVPRHERTRPKKAQEVSK